MELLSKNEFKANYEYPTYETYLSYHQKLKENAIKNSEILLYSTKHNIKHDQFYNYHDGIVESIMYQNTKLKVNHIYHFSGIIALIIAITSGGVISNEHNSGTIKNIITSPVRRWKILLSKFIYLVIDMYLIWFLGLLILSLCAGMKYGFSDLLTPKILYVGNEVIEVNYYLYLIKNIFLVSIPMICFISIILFLSVLTLNTSLTVGISSILDVLTPGVWLLMMIGNIKQIVYTPLWYFDSGFILNNSERYIESLQKVNYSLSTGILISLILILLFYRITNIIYIKRDIKN